MGHGTMGRTVVSLTGLVVGLAGVVPVALAQVSSIVWHEVGDPGNDPWQDSRYQDLKFYGRGRVDYGYRMAETELTAGQWVEFARAYGPLADDPLSFDITGSYINAWYEGDQVRYEVRPGAELYPTDVNWRMAARFSNWMHNGQVHEAWAFEVGAYDTSTFGHADEYPPLYTDQATRSPGARYWIPSMDEWMKAVFYDPGRYGEGQAGWWEQPNSSDTPLVEGLPAEGGQTNSSLTWIYGRYGDHLNAGQYPDERTPWGLLDASGGQPEWTEEWTDWVQDSRHIRGSDFYNPPGEGQFWDWVGEDYLNWDPAFTGIVGVRVAMIPATPSLTPLALCFLLSHRRRTPWGTG